MIPDLPFFARDRIRSGTSRFSYDPYTLFLHDGGCEDYKDGDRRMLDRGKLFRGSFAYHTAKVHELTHWIQTTSTTIGALLSLVRYVQQRTAEHMLHAMKPSIRQRVLDRRILHGQPLLPSGPDGIDITSAGRELSIDPVRLQMWLDCLAVDKLLYSTETPIPDRQFPSNIVLGEILGDCFLYLAGELSMGTYPGHETARGLFRVATGPGAVQTGDGEHLTTENIIECGATINELLTGSNFAWFIELVGVGVDRQQSLRTLLETSYGRAARWFLKLTKAPADRLTELLPALSVICDLSLNPPVPPQYLSFHRVLDWNEIYPPYRFVRLTRACSRVGLLEMGAAHKTVVEFSRRLCDSAGIEHPLDYPTGLQNWGGSVDLRHELRDRWDFRGGVNGWYKVLLSTNQRMWELRQTSWPFCSNFGECTFGENLSKYITLLVDDPDSAHWFVHPYLYAMRDASCKISGAIHKKNGEYLGISVAYSHFLYDFMIGQGSFDFSCLPTQMHPHVTALPTAFRDVWANTSNRDAPLG